MNGRKIRRDTKIVILSVMILTIVTLSVSYSAFFTVQSLSSIQEIATGSLDVDVTVDNTKSMSAGSEIFPVTPDQLNCSKFYSIVTLTNNGDLDAEFSVSVGYDYDAIRADYNDYANMTDAELRGLLVPFDYLQVAVYDNESTDGNFNNFSTTGENFYPIISSLSPSASDEYTFPILRDSVEVDDTRSFNVYVWLSENTPFSEIGKLAYVKINVKVAAGTETISKDYSIG